MTARIVLPGIYRGARPGTARAEERIQDLQRFAEELKVLAAKAPFRMSARGYCYLLEEHGLAKGDFDRAERLINLLRTGDDTTPPMLPVDFTADDEARRPQGSDGTHADDALEEELEWMWEQQIQAHIARYAPVRWVDFQRCYCEAVFEKIDLVPLFSPVAREFRTLVSNSRGDRDINARAAMLRRFQDRKAEGLRCVLLLCGDHDPKGLAITDDVHATLDKLRGCTFDDGTRITLRSEDIEIVRFGLNRDFIDAHRLTWVDNLMTGSGKDLASPEHPDHRKDYVQRYLREHGARKVEANALVVRVEPARDLFRRILERYIDPDGVQRYRDAVSEARERLKLALPEFLLQKLAA